MQLCICKECSDAQFDRCMKQTRRFEMVAVESSCTDEFSTYLFCISDGVELGYDARCSREEQRLADCFQGTAIARPARTQPIYASL